MFLLHLLAFPHQGCVWVRSHVHLSTPTMLPPHALAHSHFLVPLLMVSCSHSYVSNSVWMSRMDRLSISGLVWVFDQSSIEIITKLCDKLSELFDRSDTELFWQIFHLSACLLIIMSIWLWQHTANSRWNQNHKNWGRFQPLANPQLKASLNCVTSFQNYLTGLILNYIGKSAICQPV